MNCSPPGSSVREIILARILERVVISSSEGSSRPGIEPSFPVASALVGGFFTPEALGKPSLTVYPWITHLSLSEAQFLVQGQAATYCVEWWNVLKYEHMKQNRC